MPLVAKGVFDLWFQLGCSRSTSTSWLAMLVAFSFVAVILRIRINPVKLPVVLLFLALATAVAITLLALMTLRMPINHKTRQGTSHIFRLLLRTRLLVSKPHRPRRTLTQRTHEMRMRPLSPMLVVKRLL